MLKTLRAMFEQHVTAFADDPRSVHSLELASAALLLEISRADETVAAIELETMRDAMARVFHLQPAEVDDLIEAAHGAVDEAVSLYDFTAVLNGRFSREQKQRLVEMLWAVAYADGQVDRYEEYYVRKIAELLHVSHGDYIRAKLAAASE